MAVCDQYGLALDGMDFRRGSGGVNLIFRPGRLYLCFSGGTTQSAVRLVCKKQKVWAGSGSTRPSAAGAGKADFSLGTIYRNLGSARDFCLNLDLRIVREGSSDGADAAHFNGCVENE